MLSKQEQDFLKEKLENARIRSIEFKPNETVLEVRTYEQYGNGPEPLDHTLTIKNGSIFVDGILEHMDLTPSN